MRARGGERGGGGGERGGRRQVLAGVCGNAWGAESDGKGAYWVREAEAAELHGAVGNHDS